MFSENCKKISMTNAHIQVFIKNFKCKGIFLPSSLDSMLSPTSRNVFTSVICSGVTVVQSFASHVAGVSVKGCLFHSMCSHEFIWLVANESTQFDVGNIMSNLHSLTNFIWNWTDFCGSLVSLFFANDFSVEQVYPPLTWYISNGQTVGQFNNIWKFLKNSWKSQMDQLFKNSGKDNENSQPLPYNRSDWAMLCSNGQFADRWAGVFFPV